MGQTYPGTRESLRTLQPGVFELRWRTPGKYADRPVVEMNSLLGILLLNGSKLGDNILEACFWRNKSEQSLSFLLPGHS